MTTAPAPVRQSEANCANCAFRWHVNTNLCHCPNCHRSFGGLSGFDAHRTGPWGARRCVADSDLAAAGYELDSRGVWRQPRPAESIPGHIAEGTSR